MRFEIMRSLVSEQVYLSIGSLTSSVVFFIHHAVGTNFVGAFMPDRIAWKIIEPKQSIGPYGFRAIILDSEGNRLALHSGA
jgi:hypothetical protein